MSADNAGIEYDEDDAVKFIRQTLPQEMKSKFSDDEINYVVDVIYDFYDSKGFMDSDVSEDALVEIDEDEIIGYVLKNTKKDQIRDFTEEEITFIVQGELKYCDSLDIFE